MKYLLVFNVIILTGCAAMSESSNDKNCKLDEMSPSFSLICDDGEETPVDDNPDDIDSCSVKKDSTGTTISCPDGTNVFIETVQNYVILKQICQKEYVVCWNNELFGMKAVGKNTWLVKINPGTYYSPCIFTVNENCEVISE